MPAIYSNIKNKLWKSNLKFKSSSLFFQREGLLFSYKGETRKDWLHELLLDVHREYQTNVTGGLMTYKVFVQQFIDGHYYTKCASCEDKNAHRKALGLVNLLLTERQKLAMDFFNINVPNEVDLDDVVNALYHGSSISARPNNRRVLPLDMDCKLQEEDMLLLADCANKTKLFKDTHVTAAMMSDLMQGKLAVPLVASNLSGIVYLFDELSKLDVVTKRWQAVLEHDASILLQKGGKPQKATNYSSALNRAKANPGFNNKADIDVLICHFQGKYNQK